MRYEARLWLGFAVAVGLAVVFVLGRADDDGSQLSAGTSLPSTTIALPTTARTATTTSTSTTTTTVAGTTSTTARRGLPTPAPAPTSPPATPSPTAAPSEPPRVQFGWGTYRIGVDLPPGTYRTEGGTDGGDQCYWARLSSLSGTPESVIASQETSGGPVTVTIEPTDAAFSTAGCAPWTSV